MSRSARTYLDLTPRIELPLSACELVLLEEIDAALALVPEQIRSNQLTRGELVAWPILRRLREHGGFPTVLAELDAQGTD